MKNSTSVSTDITESYRSTWSNK